MKKLISYLLILIVLITLSIYVFIPEKLNVTSSTHLATTDIGTERFLSNESNWNNWWNKLDSSSINKEKKPGSYFLNGFDFTIKNKFYKSLEIQINNSTRSISSKMVIVALTIDTTGVEWSTQLDAGKSPFSRLTTYLEAKELKANMDAVLKNLKTFLSDNEHVYGIKIQRDRLKDTLYVTAKNSFTKRPGISETYTLIHKIQDYATKNGANITGSPIFNISELGDNNFQLMAGIPVDKHLEGTEFFNTKYMVKGSFMIAEVVGGDSSIERSSKALLQYFNDYRKTSMAMSFTMLVTDRSLQPDTSKWITRLYQPVY
jgi:hypothetical protein